MMHIARLAAAGCLIAQAAGANVAVALPTAGTYPATWRASSVDMHRTEGSYRFTRAATELSGINVEHAWARPSAGAATTGAAYLTVTDTGQPDRITGAASPAAATVQVHETIDDHGVMKMRSVDGISLEPGKPVT